MKDLLKRRILFIVKCAGVAGIFYSLRIFVNDDPIAVMQLRRKTIFRKI